MFVMDVDITNKNTNEQLPTMTHIFEADDKNEDISDLRNNFKSFDGTFEIIVQNQVVSKSVIQSGVVTSRQLMAYYGDYDCTIDGITTCADDEINDMNWIEYAFCAATAPACLARIYSSCLWENC